MNLYEGALIPRKLPCPKKFLVTRLLLRNYKNFDINTFKKVLRLKLQSVKSSGSFEQVLLEVFNKHAPLKKIFLRANHAPYMTKLLLKAIMRRT